MTMLRHFLRTLDLLGGRGRSPPPEVSGTAHKPAPSRLALRQIIATNV
jgi:hypothetical protein